MSPLSSSDQNMGGTFKQKGCAPSKCLADFDEHSEVYAPLVAFGLWNQELEAAADTCDAIAAPHGRMYEALISIFNGGRQGEEMTTHWSFCAPSHCADDDAAALSHFPTMCPYVFLKHDMFLTNIGVHNHTACHDVAMGIPGSCSGTSCSICAFLAVPGGGPAGWLHCQWTTTPLQG
eukprot:symbB.v1.2.029000.t1/scaffold3118.1/size63164/7